MTSIRPLGPYELPATQPGDGALIARHDASLGKLDRSGAEAAPAFLPNQRGFIPRQFRNLQVLWVKERDAILAALWAEELSTAEIGRRMGISKNAVIGRAHRLGFKKRAAPLMRRQKIEILLKEPKGCRFIHGDPRDLDWRYCQEPQVNKADGTLSSWCQLHFVLCHQRPVAQQTFTLPKLTTIGWWP